MDFQLGHTGLPGSLRWDELQIAGIVLEGQVHLIFEHRSVRISSIHMFWKATAHHLIRFEMGIHSEHDVDRLIGSKALFLIDGDNLMGLPNPDFFFKPFSRRNEVEHPRWRRIIIVGVTSSFRF